MERTYTKIRSKESIENKSGVNVKYFEKGNKDVIITDVAIRNYQIGGYTKKDKNHYLDVRDNMIKPYNHNLVRSEKSIKRSMSTLRDFLHNYFNGDKNEVFVTLTTANKVVSVKEIKQYFKEYWKELEKFYGDGLVYAYVLEICQNRFALHIHCIIKDLKHKYLFIPNDLNQMYWKKGITRVTRIVSRDSGNYYIDEETAIAEPNSVLAKRKTYGINKVINYITKSYTKEHMPRGARIYETSSKLKKAVKVGIVEYGELTDSLKGVGATYQSGTTLSIVDIESNKEVNKITKEKWRMK